MGSCSHRLISYAYGLLLIGSLFLLLDAGFSWSIGLCWISSDIEENQSLDLLSLADETGGQWKQFNSYLSVKFQNSSKNAAGQSACVDFLSLANVMYFLQELYHIFFVQKKGNFITFSNLKTHRTIQWKQ